MPIPALALIAARPISLRYSLLALLSRLPQIDALQSVEDLRSLLATLPIAQPKLVVLDVDLQDEGTGSVLAQIKTLAPQVCVVVLADRIDQQQALQTAPADLVLLKGYPAAKLFDSIEGLLGQNEPGASSYSRQREESHEQ
jgi:DNA-binding NarL/FixJ family response regulator